MYEALKHQENPHNPPKFWHAQWRPMMIAQRIMLKARYLATGNLWRAHECGYANMI